MVISWRGGDAERYKSQTRDETFVSEASFLGPPESYARMGRAEALVARRFSGAVSAMRLKCRMRVQNYCFFGIWPIVVRALKMACPDLCFSASDFPLPIAGGKRKNYKCQKYKILQVRGGNNCRYEEVAKSTSSYLLFYRAS